GCRPMPLRSLSLLSWPKHRVSVGLIALVAVVNVALAQDPSRSVTETSFPAISDPAAELAELRARVEQLERENAAKAESASTAVAPQTEVHTIGSDLQMQAKWNHGLELSTPHKDFRVHVGGRVQFDSS